MTLKSILFVFLLVTMLSLPYFTDASCRKLGRCCNGKNVSSVKSLFNCRLVNLKTFTKRFNSF